VPNSILRTLGFVLLLSCLTFSVAQQNSQPTAPAPVKVTEVEVNAIHPDPQIAEALKQISPERIRVTIEKLVTFKNRNTLSSNDQEMISQGLGVTAAAKWIQEELERYSQACGGCLQVKTDSFTQPVATRVPTPTPLTNVYAVLQGTDPENAKRIYLVTGHYDSRNSDTLNTKDAAPGANDDASGTAVSLECARVLSKYKFPATLIFLSVAGEEQGLDGAKHFAQTARQQGWDIQGVLNNDIVGGNTTPGDTMQRKDTVRVFSEGIPASAKPEDVTRIRNLGGENDSPSRELARYIRSAAKEYLPRFQPTLIFRRDRFLRGGDHTAFNEEGFAGVRFTEFREDFNHQHQNVRTENGIEYGDVPKFVDFAYVANVARMNAAALTSLASAPAPPATVRIETRGLTNDTTLNWEASPGGLANSYQILWRDTDQPYWQHAMNAPAGSSITLPISKDNVVFAVRALDAKGHASLPVVPRPRGRIEAPGGNSTASSGM
jgi:Peptidase family M28